MSASRTTPAPAFPTVDTYLAADKSGKSTIRRDVTRAMDDAIRAMDLETAMAARTALDTYVTPAAAPADTMTDTDRWTRRVAVAKIIFDAVVSAATDAGVDGSDYVPDDTDHAHATKIISTVVGTYAPRRDVAAYIIAALNDLGAGRHTVADIIGWDRDAAPSSGAVAARLFPKITVDGVVTYPADADHTARTVALAD